MTGWLAILLVCAVAAACGADRSRGRGAIRVAAASDLNAALGDIIARFSATHAVDVAATYGSSGNFFSQLMNGAPFDVFLSADMEYPRRLAERGLTIQGSEFSYGVGRLVLWTPAASPLAARGGGLRTLTDPSVARVAIANPEHAPYGRAAVAAMKTAGVYDAMHGKLVYGENIGQALQFAQSGAADAAIVALSLVAAPSGARSGRWFDIPLADYPRVVQGGVIMRAAADPASAQAFRAFLLDQEGRSILEQYGFSPPEP